MWLEPPALTGSTREQGQHGGICTGPASWPRRISKAASLSLSSLTFKLGYYPHLKRQRQPGKAGKTGGCGVCRSRFKKKNSSACKLGDLRHTQSLTPPLPSLPNRVMMVFWKVPVRLEIVLMMRALQAPGAGQRAL